MILFKARKFCILLFLSLVVVSFSAQSGNITTGKEKAALCSGCHGADGISVSSIIPNLAGQKEEYLVLSLKAFKSGSRKNGIMSSIVSGLSNDDMDDVAAYYSSLSSAK